jgi:molybdate transport system substrate-binding protein
MSCLLYEQGSADGNGNNLNNKHGNEIHPCSLVASVLLPSMSRNGVLGAVVATLLLAAGMLMLTKERQFSASTKQPDALEAWCAAGLKGPVEELAALYEGAYGTRIRLTYGGSGTLLATLETTRKGDILLAADAAYAALAQQKGLAQHAIPLAQMHAVLAVQAGNPLKIAGWADLLTRPQLRYGLCHPSTAAIGATVQRVAESQHAWPQLQASAAVMRSTVAELALDLKAGALDAAILWHHTAAALPELATVPCAELTDANANAVGAVLTSSTAAPAAQQFLQWISSAEHGAPVWRKWHFTLAEDAPPP